MTVALIRGPGAMNATVVYFTVLKKPGEIPCPRC